jgi:hypothetical protein
MHRAVAHDFPAGARRTITTSMLSHQHGDGQRLARALDGAIAQLT